MGVAEQLRTLAGELESTAEHLDRIAATVGRMISAGVKLEEDQAALNQILKALRGTVSEWMTLADQLDRRHPFQR